MRPTPDGRKTAGYRWWSQAVRSECSKPSPRPQINPKPRLREPATRRSRSEGYAIRGDRKAYPSKSEFSEAFKREEPAGTRYRPVLLPTQPVLPGLRYARKECVHAA